MNRPRVALLLVEDERAGGRASDASGGRMAARLAAIGADLAAYRTVSGVSASAASIEDLAASNDLVVVCGSAGEVPFARTEVTPGRATVIALSGDANRLSETFDEVVVPWIESHARRIVRATFGEDGAASAPLRRLEEAVVRALASRGLRVATAESITGGLVASALISVAGASEVFERGWVVYTVEAKVAELDVPAARIERDGVVSEAVARAMAEGARVRAGVDLAVATTGVAGPATLTGPDARTVPVGRVHVALAQSGSPGLHRVLDLPFPRELVRRRAALAALDLIRRAIGS